MSEQDWMTPDEWERERDRHGDAVRRGMASTPEQRREHRIRYLRDWHQKRRYGTDAPIMGWLHELACEGNHRGNRACKPLAWHG